MRHMSNNKGITLVELMVAMVVSMVVMAGIYAAYYSQQKSYLAQEQVADMQQSLRAAIYQMAKEIRMAGYDPTGKAGAGITEMDREKIEFTMDLDQDEDVDGPNETVSYYTTEAGNLVRNSDNHVIADNIDAIDIQYLDVNGVTTGDPLEVRSVEVCLVAKTDRRDPGYTHSRTYKNLRDEDIYDPNPTDGFRRRLLTAGIKCRNLGL